MNLPDVIGDHRIIELIGQGASGKVYKVLCPKTGNQIALKLLLSSLTTSVVEKLRFEREFRLTTTCEHPFLVKALDYGTSSGRPFYTMDLVEGVNFRSRFGLLRDQPEKDVFARVVEGLLCALSHIHEKQIVHRDLKPENVFVTAQDEPRILDFGLATPHHSKDDQRLTNPGTVVGTIHYMSPEQLSSRPLDGRTDLFSLGTMLFEVLAGELPFDADHPIGVMGQILSKPPRELKIPTGFPPELARLVMKLLQKEPSDRYQTAKEALVDWRQIMLGMSEPAEVRSIESPEQLYMPRFVGQSQALAAYKSLQNGTPNRVLLVAGKSGAGKTRFLEECCALAKAAGLPQTGARAGGAEASTYQLWLPTLRQAFRRPPPDLMAVRSILSPLLPELGYSKDAATTKAQLFEAMSRTVRFQGGLVWIDDAHLGDAASLEFLHYLARRVEPTDSLMVVATYNPGQAEDFVKRTRDGLIGADFARECELEALTQSETQTMVSSMLGGDFNAQSAALLFGETGGNPLFNGEVVKAALADRHLRLVSGEWQLLSGGKRTIPHTMREQLNRQLQSLEADDLESLKLAAIIGFDFNFELLSLISPLPKMDLLDRVLRVSDKGFLIESDEVCFRFGSRALHQVLLEATPEDIRPALHYSVASALETLHPRQRWVADIARQYELAGHLDKAFSHLLAAATEASRNFAHKDAVEFYSRTLQVPQSQRHLTDDTLKEQRADSLQGLGDFESAQADYQELLLRAQAKISQVRLRRKIAECQQMLGQFEAAYKNLRESLILLGVEPSPEETAVQKPVSALSWVQKSFQKLSGKFNNDAMLAEQLHRVLDRQLSTLFFLRPCSWTKELFELALLQKKVAKQIDEPNIIAQAQIFLGFTDLQKGKRESAAAQWEVGIAIAKDLRDSPYKALLLRNIALMYLLGGNPIKASELCELTQEISERIGDRPGFTQCHMVRCAIELHRAHFDKALEHAKHLLSSADDAGLPVYRVLGWSYLARATAHNDYLNEAEDYLNKAIVLAEKIKAPYVDMIIYLAKAWVYCDLGQHARSIDATTEGLAFCEKIEALPFYRLTLRCAGLWAAVEQHSQESRTLARTTALAMRLHSFKNESQSQGLVQFVKIADELLEKILRQSRK